MVVYSRDDDTVRIDLAAFSASEVLPTIEAICNVIAAADPDGNPYGLFCNPCSDRETGLVFSYDAMLYQSHMALIVEQMYVSCNNPAHIFVETSGTHSITGALARQVKFHLKAAQDGGYVAGHRPRATWVWKCFTGPNTNCDVMRAYTRVGGSILSLN